MRQTRRAYQLTSLLSALFLVALLTEVTGCTLIGLSMGAIADSESGGFEKKGPSEMGAVDPGDSVIVVRASGDSIAGTFIELAPRPTEEYTSEFAPLTRAFAGGLFPPALGDTIKIVSLKDGVSSVVRGTFSGIDPGYIYVQLADPFGEKGIEVGNISSIICTDRSIVSGDSVRAIVRRQLFPSTLSLAIATELDTLRIPRDKIDVVLLPEGMSGALKGLVIGAMIDVAIIAVVATSKPLDFHFGIIQSSY